MPNMHTFQLVKNMLGQCIFLIYQPASQKAHFRHNNTSHTKVKAEMCEHL